MLKLSQVLFLTIMTSWMLKFNGLNAEIESHVLLQDNYDKLDAEIESQIESAAAEGIPVKRISEKELWIKACDGPKHGRVFALGEEGRGLIRSGKVSTTPIQDSSSYESQVQPLQDEIKDIRSTLSNFIEKQQQFQDTILQLLRTQGGPPSTVNVPNSNSGSNANPSSQHFTLWMDANILNFDLHVPGSLRKQFCYDVVCTYFGGIILDKVMLGFVGSYFGLLQKGYQMSLQKRNRQYYDVVVGMVYATLWRMDMNLSMTLMDILCIIMLWLFMVIQNSNTDELKNKLLFDISLALFMQIRGYYTFKLTHESFLKT